MDVQKMLSNVQSFYEETGSALDGFGGHLRCEECGLTRELGDTSENLRGGWPKHCGYTMRWWTQSQIDNGEMPQFSPLGE